MPEKMVGLNRIVLITITLGAGEGCRWESLTCPWGCMSSILRAAVRALPLRAVGLFWTLLKHGEVGRARDVLRDRVANWWEEEEEIKGWRRCSGHLHGQVEQGKVCCGRERQHESSPVTGRQWAQTILLWKGTCGLNTFLLKMCLSITREPHPSIIDIKFLVHEHELLGQMGI